MANNEKRAQEIEQCAREARFLEDSLTRNPGQTHLWILRSEIYTHLARINPATHYTTEQLFFGAYVAGLSQQATRKAAFSYSFISQFDKKKRDEIAKGLDLDADT
jgi:hypothetical protein